jgi:hypothetical protein
MIHYARRYGALGAALVITAAMVSAASSTADTVGPACTVNTQNSIVCLTVSDTPDPVAYSSTDGNITYLHYDATVANTGKQNNDTHVGLTEVLDSKTTYVANSATTTQGSCSFSAGTVTCNIGSLAPGASARVQVTVTSPATSSSNPPSTTVTNTLTASFDSGVNNGRQTTVTTKSTTTVTGLAGQTYVPQGTDGQVDTNPAAAQYGNVHITDASVNVLAKITLGASDSFCLLGQVTIQGSVYVCRNGGFVQASVTNADTGAGYSNAANPLVFHLRWNSNLISVLQTVDNFVVFYKSTATGAVEVFQNRCDATASNLPCLRNIVKASDGSWSVDLVKADNGFMR